MIEGALYLGGSMRGISDEAEKLLNQQRVISSVGNASYSPVRDYLQGYLKSWFNLKAFFAQRTAILNNPTIMTRYPAGVDKTFQSPLTFSVQCVGFDLAVLSIIATPLQFFFEPVDEINAAYIKWLIATVAKIDAIIIPVTILVSSYIFAVMIFKKPLTLAMYHADVIHLTYIQALLFWPNTVLSLILISSPRASG
jgi:hypothetical protein